MFKIIGARKEIFSLRFRGVRIHGNFMIIVVKLVLSSAMLMTTFTKKLTRKNIQRSFKSDSRMIGSSMTKKVTRQPIIYLCFFCLFE